MASERSGLLSEGALYETIARGNKDTYFLSKNACGTTINPFETRYLRTPGTVSELRRTTPLNGPDFGRACEFEFDVAGDIFIEPTLLIDLPSWLPPADALLNETSGYSIATPAGRQYGYTRGIAYFLFSKIQIFQDKILLQEFSGDTLWASRLSRGSLNSAYLDQKLSGMGDPSVPLYRNATPGRLRLQLPMIGGAQGLPSIGMRRQTFRLRLVLRSLEDCVECTDDTVLRPAPWTEPVFTVTDPNATTTSVKPIARELIAKPLLQLESRHIYADPESRGALESKNHEIPYSLLYENTFTFGGLDFTTSTALAPSFTRPIDARHPASRAFWFLRTRDDLGRNRRWATSGPGGPYYQSISLIIASRDREIKFPPLIWNTLTLQAKEDKDPGFSIGEMNWDIGSYTGLPSKRERVPEGSVNFSTADRPVIYIEVLPPVAPQLFTTGVLEMLFVVESWSLYTIEEGRGALRYGN